VARLTPSQRKKLPDSAFAYIGPDGERRLPIHDEAHVRNALARFERVAFPDDASRERARRRLLQAAKRYGIVPIGFITGQLRTERTARRGGVAHLPTGAVAFLMSDIEGSTKLLRRLDDGYPAVLSQVRRIHRRVVGSLGGHEIDARADEYFACFERPEIALEAAVAIQRRIGDHAWPKGSPVRVRIGIHQGRPTLTDEGYVGLSVHTVARVCAAGHGGQIVVSQRVRDLTTGRLPTGLTLRAAGSHALRGLPGTQPLYTVRAKGLRSVSAPLRTG
jgi:class 3 adenylate cyclase